VRRDALVPMALLAKLFLGVLFVGASCPAIADTLYSYDPAETYGGHSWSSTADALASSFTLPTGSPTYKLDQLRIRISYTDTDEPITPITVCLWENDAGSPGSLIWSQAVADVNGPTTGAASYFWWNEFDITSAPAIAGGTTIFAGYTSTSFADIAPSWSADSSTMTGIQGSWYRSKDSGEWSDKNYDRMMQLDIVPEPSSLVLLAGLSGMGLIALWRRRHRAN